jgi:hypothetical protein
MRQFVRRNEACTLFIDPNSNNFTNAFVMLAQNATPTAAFILFTLGLVESTFLGLIKYSETSLEIG